MTDTTNAVPNPGSPEAVYKGCTCPILDNAKGRGYLGIPGMFVMNAGCPLHGVNETDTVEDTRLDDYIRDLIDSKENKENK